MRQWLRTSGDPVVVIDGGAVLSCDVVDAEVRADRVDVTEFGAVAKSFATVRRCVDVALVARRFLDGRLLILAEVLDALDATPCRHDAVVRDAVYATMAEHGVLILRRLINDDLSVGIGGMFLDARCVSVRRTDQVDGLCRVEIEVRTLSMVVDVREEWMLSFDAVRKREIASRVAAGWPLLQRALAEATR